MDWIRHSPISCRYIQSTCATSGEGLYEGLDWLSNNIANKVGSVVTLSRICISEIFFFFFFVVVYSYYHFSSCFRLKKDEWISSVVLFVAANECHSLIILLSLLMYL